MKTNTSPRPMKDLSLDERKQILLDLDIIGSKAVKEKWNITNNVLGHIRFFHGKSSAKGSGYYHKDLTVAEHPEFARVKELKAEGKTSGECAEITGLPLAAINKKWSSL